MTSRTKSNLLLAMIATATLGLSACDKPSTTTSSTTTPSTTTSSVGDKVDKATDKVGAATSQAADKATVVADDTAITTKVKAAILAEPGLKSLQISVDTKDGTVTLTGNVDNSEMRDKAKQVASSTTGVKGVIDQLLVKTS